MESDLRLSDLGSHKSIQTKLMNVMIPDTVAEAIDELVERLGCTKTAAIVALLNEGLDTIAQRRGELPAAAKRVRSRRPVVQPPARRVLARSKK